MTQYQRLYLGNFQNTDFAKYLHYSRKERNDYVSKLDPIKKYVDANTITDDFLKMLIIIKDELRLSEMWRYRIGVSHANIKLADVRIELSEDIKEKTYQGLQFDNTDSEIQRRNELGSEYSENDFHNEINTTRFDQRLFGTTTNLILGEYNHVDKTICLYIKAILKSVIGKYSDKSIYDNFTHRLLAVLAHELFHACHACDYDALGHCWNNDVLENEIIVESLASHFEMRFMWDELGRYDMSKELKNEWKKHAAIVWPYSGAKYIEYFIRKNDEFYHYGYDFHYRFYELKKPQLRGYPISELSRTYTEKMDVNGGWRRRRSWLFYNLSLSGLSFAQILLLDNEIQAFPFIKKLQERAYQHEIISTN